MVFLYYYYSDLMGSSITKEAVLQISIVTFREVIFTVIPLSLAVATGLLANVVMQTGFIFTHQALILHFGGSLIPLKG